MQHESSYLHDALLALDELEEFLSGTSKESFLSSRLEQSFVFHRLVILGEASVQLAKVFREKYPDVPWQSLSGLRNRLVHAYFDLDLELLWNMVNKGYAPLRSQFANILRTEFPEESAGNS